MTSAMMKSMTSMKGPFEKEALKIIGEIIKIRVLLINATCKVTSKMIKTSSRMTTPSILGASCTEATIEESKYCKSAIKLSKDKIR